MRLTEIVTEDRKEVTICLLCEDFPELESEYRGMGYQVKHAVCRKCWAACAPLVPGEVIDNADGEVVGR